MEQIALAKRDKLESLKLLWIPSHVGIIPNAYADAIADAHRFDAPKDTYPSPGSCLVRYAKLENGNTGLSVDAETNECAEVCASLVITIVQRLRLQGQDSLFLHHCLSHSNSYDHFANVCASLQKAQRGLHRRRFECDALKWERLHLSRKRKCR